MGSPEVILIEAAQATAPPCIHLKSGGHQIPDPKVSPIHPSSFDTQLFGVRYFKWALRLPIATSTPTGDYGVFD
jgi:hypothetical protein